MTLADKREAIEVLLCASNANAPGPYWLATDWGMNRVADEAWRLWVRRLRGELHDHESAAIEAAYRLIKSSPTLIREWFGAK